MLSLLLAASAEARSAILAPGRPTLTLEAADTMANAAINEARTRGFKDISVHVLDATGRTVVSKCMLGCPTLRHKLAHAKAMLCVSTHSSSRAVKDKYVPERTPQLLAMTIVGTDCATPIAAVPGGVLCRADGGGVLQTLEADGALLPHAWEQGDALVFLSHKYHCVSELTGGTRQVMVCEFWEGTENWAPTRDESARWEGEWR